MSKDIDREAYTEQYGPTEGDRVRLADTELLVEVEEDLRTPGEEAVFGGGKTLRDGQGMAPGITQKEGALDWVITNATIVDPALGIVAADIGIRNGKIAGIGKAGNPNTMDGVDMIVSASTDVFPGEGMIVTAGAIDLHVHFASTELHEHALSSGITTLIGGGYGGGVPLNHPETIAYISDWCNERAREEESVTEIREEASQLLSAEDVRDGVPEMISSIKVEPVFPDGTKLVTVHDPIRVDAETTRPMMI